MSAWRLCSVIIIIIIIIFFMVIATVTVTPTSRLLWRQTAAGFACHLDGRGAALVHVVPEGEHAGVWRISFLDGTVSDLGNLTRVKDAAVAYARSILADEKHTKETRLGRSRIAQSATADHSPTAILNNASSGLSL